MLGKWCHECTRAAPKARVAAVSWRMAACAASHLVLRNIGDPSKAGLTGAFGTIICGIRNLLHFGKIRTREKCGGKLRERNLDHS
jgi:hypothetical protein